MHAVNMSMYSNERSTIAVHKETMQRLSDLGGFGESYEDVLNRLIDQASNKERGGEP